MTTRHNVKGVYAFLFQHRDDCDHVPPGLPKKHVERAYDEELVSMPNADGNITPFVMVDVGNLDDSEYIVQMRAAAMRLARQYDHDIEYVYFGENGREHVAWIRRPE